MREYNTEKKFYTYIYFDPRKVGPFMYGDLSFDYEPFYVGKGSNGETGCKDPECNKGERNPSSFTNKAKKMEASV